MGEKGRRWEKRGKGIQEKEREKHAQLEIKEKR